MPNNKVSDARLIRGPRSDVQITMQMTHCFLISIHTSDFDLVYEVYGILRTILPTERLRLEVNLTAVIALCRKKMDAYKTGNFIYGRIERWLREAKIGGSVNWKQTMIRKAVLQKEMNVTEQG